jgi:hypothetical protein
MKTKILPAMLLLAIFAVAFTQCTDVKALALVKSGSSAYEKGDYDLAITDLTQARRYGYIQTINY